MNRKHPKPLPSQTGSWTAKAIAASTIALGVGYACSSDNGLRVDPPDETRGELLQAAASCVLELNGTLAQDTQALVEKIDDLNKSPEDPDALSSAQEAWTDAMATWQQLELAQFGPSGSSNSESVGTRDLRDEIYSWRLTNTCRIDQGLVSEVWRQDINDQPVNARGLDAIEYLLFSPLGESNCNALVDIIADGSFEAVDDFPVRRAAYALAAAQSVDWAAKELQKSWSSDGDQFENDFVNAGTDGPYKSQGQAVDALITALIYVDTMVKDEKLGAALGLFGDCADGTCPEKFEHLPSGSSKLAIENNIQAFTRFWRGCDEGATGLDSVLRKEGNGKVADDVDAALLGIQSQLSEIEEEDLGDALKSDSDSVEKLYDAIKSLTDILKSDFVEALEVELEVVAGDND